WSVAAEPAVSRGCAGRDTWIRLGKMRGSPLARGDGPNRLDVAEKNTNYTKGHRTSSLLVAALVVVRQVGLRSRWSGGSGGGFRFE
ncbi:hypothetical protein Tco_0389605, partial [Tanacetum coccineum]